jgi:hypothetical protein
MEIDVRRTENAYLCTVCGGYCCQHAPGRYSPTDLAGQGMVTAEKIKTALDTKFVAIYTSFITPDNMRVVPVFTVAPRGVRGATLSLCSGTTWCVRLTLDGCTLTLEERPFECAAMVPNSDISQCALPGGMTMEQLWIPHQQILRELIENYAGRPWFQELSAQIGDPTNIDPYALGARELLATVGLGSDEREIDMLAARWLTEQP